MTLEEKQQSIIDEFEVFEDWIRESAAFEDQTAVPGYNAEFKIPSDGTQNLAIRNKK